MQTITADGSDTNSAHGGWVGDAALAVALALASALASAAAGVNRIVDSAGDSDSQMRLVQVRDLLAGQNWFDMTQYRMGLAGGFEMHWSRLVDAPLAALIYVARLLVGDQRMAEHAVSYLWPALLMAAALFLLVSIARTFAGRNAVLPSAILGFAALHFLGIFVPGSFDHHNVQLVLILLVMALLIGRAGMVASLFAGLAVALSLAVGMETAPLVAAIGASVAIAFLLWGDHEKPVAIGFGGGFAAAAAVATIMTVPVSRWLSTTCDAWSGAQAGAALLAGLGLAAIAAMPGISSLRTGRLTALAALALVLAGFALIVFPGCLAGPYANLDPLLRQYWLNGVTEAQSAATFMRARPGQAAGYFIPPSIAIILVAVSAFRGRSARDLLFVGLPLVAAIAVSLWQVRGAMFSVPLAIIPLSGSIAAMRGKATHSPGVAATLLLLGTWLVSFNIAWSSGVSAIAGLAWGAAPGNVAGSPSSGSACYDQSGYASLAALPPDTVLAVSNLGAPILLATRHRVLSGPYHRNIDGNLAALQALTGTPGTARGIIRANRIGLVALCPGNEETTVLADAFPQSLIASLLNERPPQWLAQIAASKDDSLRIYRYRDE